MTGLLLDTQAMLWFFWDDSRLSKSAKMLIENAGNRKVVVDARVFASRRAGLIGMRREGIGQIARGTGAGVR